MLCSALHHRWQGGCIYARCPCRQKSGKQGQQQASVAPAEGDARLKVTTVGAQARVGIVAIRACYGVAGTLPAATKIAHLLQMRRPAKIQERMLAAVAAEQANALLLLSGGHPARHVPFADK